MSHAPDANAEVSLVPPEAWHCSHLYYHFNRRALQGLTPAELATGCDAFVKRFIRRPPTHRPGCKFRLSADTKPILVSCCSTATHCRIDAVHQRLMAGPLGMALEPGYSFVSMTEVSEYVPTVEQYGQRLVAEGEDPQGPGYRAKLKAYEGREVAMRRQRLTPDFPPWPSTCFYPMNKKRKVGENWFLLPVADRQRLMAEHGRTGMTFGGRVTQLITVGLGFDDWEWGVTLWARNPEFLKEIVYRMRFDEASARYAEFGPFYTSYVTTATGVLDHCRVR